ncbi:hypothetical protein [Streptomyces paludis]|uniref:Uncharacterized protein n=1 Tax=Streptomyces paludis TaxID=2282738 RepID=A0A345HSQ7_9ACTN|nr:hypothetical protein [Streptomyces paludis]AXG79731.1 hypothetical protein DVK44_21085 [Streptomyces paludis]
MALNKKGSRRITVDGTDYRWRIRRKPTYAQAMCHAPMVYAVESADPGGPGTTLVVTTGQPHAANWLGTAPEPVRPADVAAAIRQARGSGWEPARAGSPFQLDRSAGFVPTP